MTSVESTNNINPLQCNENLYYQGGNPSSGKLIPNTGVLELLDVGIMFTGQLTQWREKFYQEYLNGLAKIQPDFKENSTYPIFSAPEKILDKGRLSSAVGTAPETPKS